jgi:sensor histidine kinase YesM
MKSALFHGFIIGIAQLLSEFITVYIFAMILNESVQDSMSVHFQIEAMAALILYFLISRLLTLFSKKENTSYSHGKWFSLLVLPLASMILLITLRITTDSVVLNLYESILLIASCALLLLTNILIFVIYDRAEQNSQKLIELEMINQKNNIDLTYLSLLEKKNEQLQILSHDYKNNLLTINSMSDSKEINEFVDNMIGEISTYNRVCKTKNKILDLILSKYVDICDDKHIAFDIDIISDNLDLLSGNDISSLFNNLLDNAVEAAEKSKNKTISLQISTSISSYHKITIINSCDTPPNSINGKLITTKRNQKVHGFGTKSINQTISKYNGELQFEYNNTNKLFKIIILIPIEQ